MSDGNQENVNSKRVFIAIPSYGGINTDGYYYFKLFHTEALHKNISS